MDFTGHFDNLMVDLMANKQKAVLTLNEDARQTFEKLKDCKKLSITIKKYRQKRSRNANSYMWELLQKMADVLSTPGHRVDKWDVYIDMLSEYGVFTHIVVKPDAVERMKREWRACKELGEITVGSMTGIQLQCYYGSHTYNTKEMAKLIDGIVTECKELGIETLPPDEIRRMKEQWGVGVG